MSKKEKEIIKESWREIKKRSIKGSGIDFSVQVLPSCKIAIAVRIRRFRKDFATCIAIDKKERIFMIVDQLLRAAKRTQKVSKEKLIKFGIITQ